MKKSKVLVQAPVTLEAIPRDALNLSFTQSIRHSTDNLAVRMRMILAKGQKYVV